MLLLRDRTNQAWRGRLTRVGVVEMRVIENNCCTFVFVFIVVFVFVFVFVFIVVFMFVFVFVFEFIVIFVFECRGIRLSRE